MSNGVGCAYDYAPCAMTPEVRTLHKLKFCGFVSVLVFVCLPPVALLSSPRRTPAAASGAGLGARTPIKPVVLLPAYSFGVR